jgi:hypothetical protein
VDPEAMKKRRQRARHKLKKLSARLDQQRPKLIAALDQQRRELNAALDQNRSELLNFMRLLYPRYAAAVTTWAIEHGYFRSEEEVSLAMTLV